MPKFKYNDGDKIGPYNILMIKRLDRRNHQWFGLFQCPYDSNHFEARISHIKDGFIKSCGCQKGRKKDLKGQKFGKLIAIEPTDQRSVGNSVIWKCQCTCKGKTEIFVPANSLTNGHTTSCGCIRSKGEEKISSVLNELNYPFQKEKWFNDCRNPQTNKVLRFDFYLPNHNYCIEYQGEQHYKCKQEGWNTKQKLEFTQYSDNLKREYCKNKQIKLIEIPYTDFNLINKEYILDRMKNG